jgi:hypothetical protein
MLKDARNRFSIQTVLRRGNAALDSDRLPPLAEASQTLSGRGR